MRKLISIKFCLLLLVVLTVINPVMGMHVSAQNVNDTNNTVETITPLEIEPICSNASAGEAHWKVTNKNAQPVNIHWNNLYNDVEGDYLAQNGVSEMLTSYDANDANNTTRFMSGSDTNQTNATKAACQPVDDPTPPVSTPPPCVDGHDQQNLVVTFVTNDTAKITVKDNKFICEDQDVYFSSYVMPASYNNQGFENNPTAYPQSIYSSTHTILQKNMPIDTLLHINLPMGCNYTQVDVYYSPEIQTVGANGHGTQNILSAIYAPAHSCDIGGNTDVTPLPITPATGGMTGGMGGGTTDVNLVETKKLGSSTVAPVTYQLPKTLPNTGSNLLLVLALLAATPVSVGSFFAAESFQKRRISISAQ